MWASLPHRTIRSAELCHQIQIVPMDSTTQHPAITIPRAGRCAFEFVLGVPAMLAVCRY